MSEIKLGLEARVRDAYQRMVDNGWSRDNFSSLTELALDMVQYDTNLEDEDAAEVERVLHQILGE